MSGREEPTKQPNPRQEEWVEKVLNFDLRPVGGRKLPRRAALEVNRKIAAALEANREITEALDSGSRRQKGIPVWAEDTTGTISAERKASVDMILDIQFDEGFKTREQEKRNKTAAELIDDKKVQEAHENWPDWYDDQKKYDKEIKAFVETVLAKQGKIIGLGDKPTNVVYVPDGGESVTTSGLFDVGSGELQIFRIDPDFQDFLNTLTHENTHAFQAKLVEGLDSGGIGPNHPDYRAALALKMNRGHSYISPDLSKQYDDEEPKMAYMEQCSEWHAFKAGDEVSSAVMEKLNARLSLEKQQQNRDRTFESKLKLSKELQAAEQQEERDELKRHAEDMEKQIAKTERAQKEQAEAAAAEQAKLEKEAERRKWEEEQDEEDLKMLQEFEKVREAHEKLEADRKMSELMKEHGVSAEQAQSIMMMEKERPKAAPLFTMMTKKDSSLTSEKFLLMLKRLAAQEAIALVEQHGISKDNAQLFMAMKERDPNLTPEGFLTALRS
jgi:hypothetical protein